MANTDFTVADVLAWARTKPATDHYVYNDTHNCALCQFLRETERSAKPIVFSGGEWFDGGANGVRHTYADALDDAVLGDAGHRSVWTFGQLVDRLEALTVSA